MYVIMSHVSFKNNIHILFCMIEQGRPGNISHVIV